MNVENTTETFVTVLRQALPSWNNTRALIGRLYWARSAPENRSRSVIGPKPERNVVLCSAAVCGGGAQGGATTETAARRLPNNKLASASATVLRGTETQVAICNLKPRGGTCDVNPLFESTLPLLWFPGPVSCVMVWSDLSHHPQSISRIGRHAGTGASCEAAGQDEGGGKTGRNNTCTGLTAAHISSLTDPQHYSSSIIANTTPAPQASMHHY